MKDQTTLKKMKTLLMKKTSWICVGLKRAEPKGEEEEESEMARRGTGENAGVIKHVLDSHERSVL